MSQPAIILWDQAYNRNGDPKLPRAVVNVIRTYMDNDTLTGFVKAETLARDTGLQVRGVRKQIAANVAAGWLKVVESGNSSGKANTYRLTYPKGVLQDTVPSEATNQRVSHRTPLESEGCPTGPVKGVLQDTPTSPRTSPQEKFIVKRTSPEKGVPQDTIPQQDPWGSAGDSSPIATTSKSNRVPQDTLATDPWEQPPSRDPERLLLDALADGPIPAKQVMGITGLDRQEVQGFMRGLITRRVIHHDTEEGTLSLS
ncbi:hypothetical protein JNN96_38140 [Mycobacterium sp. DSM 3803]|nr:hypothetical protein [Mycobacterium sp. DSM 3803]